MSERKSRTFSESWHRVANIKACLLTTIKMHKQAFRGEWWYILNDPFNNSFFRLPSSAYQFVARLNHNKTIEQVWLECLEQFPDETLGQDDVIQLLTQLHHNNLLHYNSNSDTTVSYQREEKVRKKQLKAKVIGFMFMRIPLFDPDRLIRFLLPAVKPLFSWFSGFLWLLVIVAAVVVLLGNLDSFIEQTNGVLAPGNLITLYLSMAMIKIAHELGHTFVCRYYGGEVHALGVMLVLFAPIPYMDATSSWYFRQSWHRAFVGAAGMIVEIFIAALAVFVWAYTGKGLVNSIAYNLIFIASVSTILFNANPLLKFDGYYILSDLWGIPNLYQRSRSQITYTIERYIFKCKDVVSHAHNRLESYQLVIYGVMSIIYRFILFVGIILFVADKYLLLGFMMMVMGIVLWFITPLIKLVKYLAHNNRIARRRFYAVAITLGSIIAVLLILILIPVSDRFRIPGVIEAQNYHYINAKTEGFVSQVLVDSGMSVEKGAPLIQLKNQLLINKHTSVKLKLVELAYRKEKAINKNSVDLAPIKQEYVGTQKQLKILTKQLDELTIRSPISGFWVSPDISKKKETWQTKGVTLGSVFSGEGYRFSAVASQDENAHLFQQKIKEVEIRIKGQEYKNILSSGIQIIPFQHENLPSAALGWQGGGNVEVKSDQSGIQTTEPFFQVFSDLPDLDNVEYVHGTSGILRVSLEKSPLLFQWFRSFRQLIQKRYQL